MSLSNQVFYKAAVLMPLLAAACRQDVTEGRISNRLILSGLIGNVFFRIIFAGRICLIPILESIVFPLILLLPLLIFKVMGAGDIKLFSVISCLTGIEAAVSIIWLSMLCGAVYAGWKMCRKRSLRAGKSRFAGCILAGMVCFILLHAAAQM